MGAYELWEMRSGNLVGSWAAEAEALAVIWTALETHADEIVSTMSLLAEDASGETSVIAEGLPLIELAHQPNQPPNQRSA
jgi:hypothetical protein